MSERVCRWGILGAAFIAHKNWKAIRTQPGTLLQLFDLSKDIGETIDLASAYPGVVQIIEEYLKTARTESPNWPRARGGSTSTPRS